jgi:hypothetical protein
LVKDKLPKLESLSWLDCDSSDAAFDAHKWLYKPFCYILQ